MDDMNLPPPAKDPLDAALDEIRQHLFEPLSLAAIAGRVNLSPYHFARQFSARFGQGVMAYVRAHRLEAASVLLSQPKRPALAQLAYDCGFESQEGFTRAFKRQFGVPPGQFRQARMPTAAESFIPADDTRPDDISHPQLETTGEILAKPGFELLGLSRLFDDETKHQIPLLWVELMKRLPRPVPPNVGTFGVCRAAGEQGALHYMAAVPAIIPGNIPDGLELFQVPPQSYITFRQKIDGSDLHLQMQAASREIWGYRLPRLGRKLASGPDLEVYPPGFTPAAKGLVLEWWVPVEP